MDYETFFGRFGGSARTKNTHLFKRRHFELPQQSGLPKEFIRLDPWEMEYLFSIARCAKRGILEIGRFNGGSCFVMACAAANDIPIYSIDVAPQDDELLRELFAQHQIGTNVHLIVGDSREHYPQVGVVDVAFIDGDHSYEGCMSDLVTWYDHLAPGGHLLLHDSYPGPWQVQEAIIDFMERHPELEIVQSPYIDASHWNHPFGSMAHVIKKPKSRPINIVDGSAQSNRDLLTAVVPTFNRPKLAAAQLRLFQKVSFDYRLLVADSSNAEVATEIQTAVDGEVEYEHFDAETPFFDKLAATVEKATTPFVVLVPDRKITLPHAVTAALEHLKAHDDHVTALGYVLGFGIHEDMIDINRVVFYTPTIGEDDPLRRHYHLMRRYQVSMWAVFRRENLKTAIDQARLVKGHMFQELMFMNALAIQGKICRLPLTYGLQSVEKPFRPASRNNPLHWFTENPRSFVEHYVKYREVLSGFLGERGLEPSAQLDHILDLTHAIWLRFNIDAGSMNLAVQQLLSSCPVRLSSPQTEVDWAPIEEGDEVFQGRGRTAYVWRASVLNAEPREEIQITSKDQARVQSVLEAYFEAC